ncbi:MAG TPA: PqqD family protein [Acidimicrobiales bacterium]|jgi:hypothetical protein|nr:PqqD family protein [Acidimicrobiales bacterium]
MTEHTEVEPATPLPTIVQASQHALWQVVDGEVVFLDMEGDRYFALDPVGSRIWETLMDSPDVAAAEERLLSIFEVDGPTLHRDLGELISRLAEAHLVELTS